MNGTGGKFSRMGVGKIFDIYMYDTKNWKVKAIDSLNTNCFDLVDQFQQKYLSLLSFGGLVDWSGKQTKYKF